jgi:hypothetical protein
VIYQIHTHCMAIARKYQQTFWFHTKIANKYLNLLTLSIKDHFGTMMISPTPDFSTFDCLDADEISTQRLRHGTITYKALMITWKFHARYVFTKATCESHLRFGLLAEYSNRVNQEVFGYLA